MVRTLLFGAATAVGAMLQSFVASRHEATSHAHTSAAAAAGGGDGGRFAQCATQKEVFSLKFQPFVLGEVINLAEDAAVFRFLLNNPDDEFNLVPCSTLQAHFKEGANIVDQPMRFYTPITANGTKGYFDLLVRKQRPGRFTEHLFSMDVGDSLLFRVVQYKLHYRKNRWKNVGLICGGTGICPVLQFANAALDTPGDTTKLVMLFGNRTQGQILLKGMLDDRMRTHRDRFKVFYVVDKIDKDTYTPNPAFQKTREVLQLDLNAQPTMSPEGKRYFNGFTGYMDLPLLKSTLPPPEDGTLVLVCGPDPMMAKIVGAAPMVMKAMSSGQAYQPSGSVLNNAADVSGLLGSLGYTKEHVYRF